MSHFTFSIANKWHVCAHYACHRVGSTQENSLVNSRRETTTARPHAVIPPHCFPSTTATAAAVTTTTTTRTERTARTPAAVDGNLVFSSFFFFFLPLLFPYPVRHRHLVPRHPHSSFKLFIFLASYTPSRDGFIREQPLKLKLRCCQLSRDLAGIMFCSEVSANIWNLYIG